MEKIYCGAEKLKRGYRLGSMRECAEKKQVRRYGLLKADSKTIALVKKKTTIPVTKMNLLVRSAKLKGLIRRNKGRYQGAKDKVKKAEYKKILDTSVKDLKLVQARLQKIVKDETMKLLKSKVKSSALATLTSEARKGKVKSKTKSGSGNDVNKTLDKIEKAITKNGRYAYYLVTGPKQEVKLVATGDNKKDLLTNIEEKLEGKDQYVGDALYFVDMHIDRKHIGKKHKIVVGPLSLKITEYIIMPDYKPHFYADLAIGAVWYPENELDTFSLKQVRDIIKNIYVGNIEIISTGGVTASQVLEEISAKERKVYLDARKKSSKQHVKNFNERDEEDDE